MLEYTVLSALQPNLPHYVVYFLVFHYTNVVYDIIVHVHKSRFRSCVGSNHFELKGQI